MTTLVAFAALFVSVALMQLGSGTLAPLDALSGAVLGFTPGQIGLLGSAHYAGFFVGCWAAPRLLTRVGHNRAFAGFASLGAIGALMHPMAQDPYLWALMRTATGFSVAGAYTVIESWLHARAENANRGRVFGVFRMVDLGGQLGAQALIAVLPPAAYVSYNLLALFCCLCVLPLSLTRQEAPAIEGAPALRPLATARLSPMGAAACVTAGLTGASFRMVGPVFGDAAGLSAQGVALFLAASVLGGAVSQVPVGWLSDRIDRRIVLILLSAGALAVCFWGATGAADPAALYLVAFLFGTMAFPLYSVGAAHANDFAPPGTVVELNASLMFLFGVGAILSPWLSATLIGAFGARALFVFIAVAHVVLIVFGVWRLLVRPGVEPRTPYTWLPRTSFVMARLLRRRD
jgi:MFS family permease